MNQTLSQLTPAPVSQATGMPNAFMSLVVLAGVLWMYHGRLCSRAVDHQRRFGLFLMMVGTLLNLGSAVVGKYWYVAVWSEPVWKLGACLLVIASLTERNLWGTVYDAWGRLHASDEEAPAPSPKVATEPARPAGASRR